MKSLGQRDFSAQDTMNHLLPLKLLSPSFNVVSISLDGSHKIKTNSAERNVGTNDSLLDVYAKCAMYIESIPDITILNFLILQPNIRLLTTNWHFSHPQDVLVVITNRKSSPRVFPVYSLNKKGPNYLLYCKYQLLTYKPWQTTQDNAWGDQPGNDEYMSQNEKNFWKLLLLKKMFLTGMTSYKVLKITVMMTQLLKKPHKNFLRVKNGCSHQISLLDHLLQLINHSKLLTCIITGNQTDLNIKKVK